MAAAPSNTPLIVEEERLAGLVAQCVASHEPPLAHLRAVIDSTPRHVAPTDDEPLLWLQAAASLRFAQLPAQALEVTADAIGRFGSDPRRLVALARETAAALAQLRSRTPGAFTAQHATYLRTLDLLLNAQQPAWRAIAVAAMDAGFHRVGQVFLMHVGKRVLPAWFQRYPPGTETPPSSSSAAAAGKRASPGSASQMYVWDSSPSKRPAVRSSFVVADSFGLPPLAQPDLKTATALVPATALPSPPMLTAAETGSAAASPDGMRDGVLRLQVPQGAALDEAAVEQQCLGAPIALLSGLPAACGIDLAQLSTATMLAQGHALDEIDVLQQNYREHQARLRSSPTWEYKFQRRSGTLGAYASYQEHMLKTDGAAASEGIVDFCTNIDVADHDRWEPQLRELAKLPEFLRPQSPKDLLAVYPYPILGVNRTQMYLKVHNCRTTGHQENNMLCSVNVNIGPGDCEWFAVDCKHWTDIDALCRRQGIDYLKDSWWPTSRDLDVSHVPYTRFLQRPGEVVFVSCGTVHWVESKGVTNNVAWNYAAPVLHQYKMAMDRFWWNKKEQYKSIVPMETISWMLAGFRLKDCALAEWILRESFEREQQLAAHVARGKIAVDEGNSERWHTFYCVKCNEELFNHVFVVRPAGVLNPAASETFCWACTKRVLNRATVSGMTSKATKREVQVLRRYGLAELAQRLQQLQQSLSDAPVS